MRGEAWLQSSRRRGILGAVPQLLRTTIFIICPPTSLLPAIAPPCHLEIQPPTLSPWGLCRLMAGPREDLDLSQSVSWPLCLLWVDLGPAVIIR